MINSMMTPKFIRAGLVCVAMSFTLHGFTERACAEDKPAATAAPAATADVKAESPTEAKTEKPSAKNAKDAKKETDAAKSPGDKKAAKKPEKTAGGKVNDLHPKVTIETSLGSFDVELDAEKAPISVANFLKYVDEGFYNGTIFHRVINSFMIQGGGFTEAMSQKTTHAQIKNEAGNGLKNKVGTLAMARTSVVDSASSQFFVNVRDNEFLDHKDTTPSGFGYAVFGHVTSHMDVVDKIKAVPTGFKGGMQDVPNTAVVIKSIKRLENTKK